MNVDLIAAESSLDIVRQTWSWMEDLMTWSGGVIVALSGLSVVLYVSLLWQDSGERADEEITDRRSL